MHLTSFVFVASLALSQSCNLSNAAASKSQANNEKKNVGTTTVERPASSVSISNAAIKTTMHVVQQGLCQQLDFTKVVAIDISMKSGTCPPNTLIDGKTVDKTGTCPTFQDGETMRTFVTYGEPLDAETFGKYCNEMTMAYLEPNSGIELK
ncbi:MAG: hypothetical protein EOP07_09785 [Proteobacteria bacterium]|nr:MAG: hypothetical protein EOP07_09785 [Pseudomonadota bacterium]